MGFTPHIKLILKFIPKDHQTLLFSATLPDNILRISQKYLNNPERISVGSLSEPIAKIKQETFDVAQDKKYHELINQLVERNGSILVFVKTKHGADTIVRRLKFDGHKADAIHGNLRQSKRDRVINSFKNGNSRILIATDVAARGLDIPLIEHVINYDLPQVPEDYIHRIGRTGRAGKKGSALTFLTPSDRRMWNSINRLINPNLKLLQNFKKKKFREDKKNEIIFKKKKNFSNKNKKKFFKKIKIKIQNLEKENTYRLYKQSKFFGKKASFKAKKKFKNRKDLKNLSFNKYKKKR